jgi:hypothetical protein
LPKYHCEKIDALANSVYVRKDEIFAISRSRSAGKISLFRVDTSRRTIDETISVSGSEALLLTMEKEKMFAGVDNKLLVCDKEGSPWKTVLESKNASNLFWHLVAGEDESLYVQEYGGPPTGIYRSADGQEWKLVVTAQDIDKKALHFHDMAYDAHRNMLIATLGDSNYVKVAVSKDNGENWIATYKGAWQLLPIVVTKEQIVFGMDSGVAKGGIVTWCPESNRHTVVHLGWRKNRANLMQMTDLEFLNNGIWVAALGRPQAIVASLDLDSWTPIFTRGFEKLFDYHVGLSEGENIIAFSTGEHIGWVKKVDLRRVIEETKPEIHRRSAVFDRVVGLGYVTRRKLALL